MTRFRKKPVEVEAVQFLSPYRTVQQFCPEIEFITNGGRRIAFGVIHTLEGTMRADLGDWIIKGVLGEFYPCKPAIFEATYEPVESA